MKYIVLILTFLGVILCQAPPSMDSSWQTATLGAANDDTLATNANFMLKYAPDMDQTNNSDVIHFMLSGMSPGYMSFGVSNGPKMQNIDIVSFEYDMNNNPMITVTDRFANSMAVPMADDMQNANNYLNFDMTSSFDSSTNMWMLKWSRKLISTDIDKDIPIYCGLNAVVVATANSPMFSQHTLYQFSSLNIEMTLFTGCTNAPMGWTDWLNPMDPNNNKEVKEESSMILQVSLVLLVLSLILF